MAMLIPAAGWARPGGAQTGAAGEEPWGKTVVGIELQTDAALKLSQFPGRVAQETGQPLAREKVSASLKNLYRTGRFVELEARAEAAAGGVELIFEGTARYFVGTVEVRGAPSALDAQALANSTRLRLGRPVYDTSLPAAVASLKESLDENAYYRAQVKAEVRRDPATQEANIEFVVTPGRPALLGKVTVGGQAVFPTAQLIQVAHWRLGRHLTAVRAEQGVFRLHTFYSKRGYLRANVVLAKRAYEPKSNTESLDLEIDAGPVIQVRVRGGGISGGTLRNLLPVYTDGIVDDPSLERGARALQDYFQKKGYLHATVRAEPVSRPKPGRVNITYDVTLGDAGDFDGYRIEGNHAIPEAELRAVLTERTGGVLFEHDIFSQQMLDENVQAIKALYESRGYLAARVVPEESGNLSVTLKIEEGPKTVVRNLGLEGVTPELKSGLAPRLSNLPGLPFSPQNVEKDRLAILRYLANRGYAEARVEAAVKPAAGEHAEDVTYSVEAGTRQTFGRILVLGDEHTRRATLDREVTLEPGQASNESDILESQNRLYGLGIFNQVEIAPQDPGGDETSKPMLVDVEEARRWTLGYGGGIEVQRLGNGQPQGQFKVSPSALVEVTRLNVGGRAQTATLRGRFSALDRLASLSYLVPRVPAHRTLSVRFGGLFERSSNVLTFTAERAEVSVDVEKRYSPHTLLAAHFSFRNVRALNIKISPQEIPLFNRSARIGMLGLGYINDHRDNPADPTRGSYTLADAGVASTHFGSQANFLRVSAQNSTYYRLGSRAIFARNTEIGIESPFGALQTFQTTVNGVAETIRTHAIPLPERFFMGGSESDRAFSINQAGPRDLSGFPVGGNALFLNTSELRIPFAENRMGVVLFHDMGNVYSSARLMRLLKVTQSSPQDFDYTVHAVGLGFRYKTPVGPLRFDFAYALNPPRYDVQTQANGHTSTEVQQLPHFQFFIGIGQTF